MRHWQKVIALIVLLFSVAFFLRIFDVVEFLSEHNVYWKIIIVSETSIEIYIDFYGGIIPMVFSLLLFFCLVYFRKFPFKLYLRYFPLSVLFGLMLSSFTNGIVVMYLVFGFLVGLLVVSLAFYNGDPIKLLKKRDFRSLNFTKKNYVNALLMSFSYASLSILAVDLIYLVLYLSVDLIYLHSTFSMYIGAMGLSDGIMVSGLITPLCMIMETSFFMLHYEIAHLLRDKKEGNFI